MKSPIVWKPHGTPFVTQISRDDPVTGSDIQKIAHTMLSPMLRLEKLQAISQKSKDSLVQDFSNADNSMNLSTSSTSQDQNTSISSISSADFILPLQLVDENGACIDLSTEEAQTTKLSLLSTSLIIRLNWPSKDYDEYNIYHLENLPEVLKYASAPKKSRNEPLSLYACMEAFLREEPLVPEDMW